MDTQEHDVHHVDPELVVREIRSLLGHADSI
jgi:hypothetical protein